MTKVVAPNGAVTYTNAGQGFTPGVVTPQNDAAAVALDARSRGQVPADVAPVTPVTVVGDGGGYGLLSKDAQAARNRGFDVANATQGLSARQRANYLATTGATEASRATAQEQIAATLSGQQLTAKAAADRLAVEKAAQGTTAATGAATAAHLNSQTQAAQDLQAAKLAYGAALQGGDPKAIARAELGLRGAQGRWEKDNTRLMVVPGGTTPDPNNPGQYIHQPSMIFDPDAGKFISPPGAGAAPAKSTGTSKEDYAALPNGSQYVGTDGKTYIKRSN